MKLLPVREAAPVLGVSARRVRALIDAGRLQARKVGSQWIVEMPGPRVVAPGRPIGAKNAWALLSMLSGERPDWVHRSERSRLKRYMRDPGLLAFRLAAAEPRSDIRRMRVLPIDLARICGAYDVVRAGLSVELPELDVVGSREALDVYGSSRTLNELRRKLRPIEDSEDPNLLFRVPSYPWVLSGGARAGVVAADLLVHEDSRVARAARELLQILVRDRRENL